ncbi:MAG TPA: acetyl-CoA acetyltransferase [Candidatus Binatia bacterium]|nr:acetyl-CoA acetyltransferase [Candidatus Binatia bacterium]
MPVERTRPLPVVVGGGQTTDRPADPLAGREPLALMVEAATRAADDAGGGRALLAAVDTVAVVNVICWSYGDAAGLLADRLGCGPGRRINTHIGGNTPQSLVNRLCDDIAAGRSEVTLVAGAEAWHTMRAFGKAGRTPEWTPPRERTEPLWGDGRFGMSDLEIRHGAARPIDTYPLFENAWRAARGLSIAAHRAELAQFGARCAAIAAENPYAWFRDGKSAAEIDTVTAENRMIGFPYPKFMNAIIEVNQGAALLLASEAAARRLGLAPARWMYPWAGVDVTELWYVQDRVDYVSLPGMRRAAAELLATAGVALDEIRLLDLYSCFPIAPRLSAAMLGLSPDDPRPLTVTGALPWFGGPGNDYTTHALVVLLDRLRAERDAFALAHALGWNMTKHGLGLYAGTPPPAGWRRAGGPALQAWVDALPHPEIAEAPEGPAVLETYTVAHGRDGAPERGIAIGRLEDGRRFVAVTPRDRALLEAMEREEPIGRRGRVRAEGRLNVFDLRG